MAYPPETKIRARKLRAEGWTLQAIADDLGCGDGTVFRWCYPERAKAQYRAYRDKWSGTEQERQWKDASVQRHADRLKAEAQQRQRVRTDWLDAYRREQGCIDCGRTDGLLHLDHRPGEVKLFDCGNCAWRSWDVLFAEVAKCDVRCASCHSKRHWRERLAR